MEKNSTQPTNYPTLISTSMQTEVVPICEIQEILRLESLLNNIQQTGGSFSAAAKEIVDMYGWTTKIPGKHSDALNNAKAQVLRRNNLFQHRIALRKYVYLLIEHAKDVAKLQSTAINRCAPREIFYNENANTIQKYNYCKTEFEINNQSNKLQENEIIVLQNKLGSLYPIHRSKDNIHYFMKTFLRVDCQKMKVEEKGGNFYLFSHIQQEFIQSLKSKQEFEEFIRNTLLKQFMLQYQLAQRHGVELTYTLADYVDAVVCLLIECFWEKSVSSDAVHLGQLPHLVVRQGNLMQLALEKIYAITQ